MTKHKIMLYGADWCHPCHQVRKILDNHGISYGYANVTEENVVIPKLIIDGKEYTGSEPIAKAIRKLIKKK